jgi:hypothetical protein
MVDAPKLAHPRFYPSPVDYEAWGKGYMPPSEHVLIDQLAYRGARVISSSDSGRPDGPAYWLVVRGKTNPKRIGLALMQLMEDWEIEEAAEPSNPAESDADSPSEASACTPATDDQDPLTAARKEGM